LLPVRAITSKPKEDAAAELGLSLRGKGLSYFSPIVRLRQEFDLYTNLRPCKAYQETRSITGRISTW